jgi:hypothetical protein
MEFKITEEVVTELGITQEQAQKLAEYGNNYIGAELPKVKLDIENQLRPLIETEYKGKANKDFEGIASGAFKSVEDRFGVKRNDGEKVADFLERVKSEVIKQPDNFNVKETKEYQELFANFDNSQKKLANFDELSEKASKFDEVSNRMTELIRNQAFLSVKPSKPQDVNQYEFEAKWKEFNERVLSEYDLVDESGKTIAVSKANHHEKHDLKDLLAKDANITELLKGRQQGGLNIQQGGGKKVDGLPFVLPQNSTKEQLVALINAHIVTANIPKKDADSTFLSLYKIGSQNL